MMPVDLLITLNVALAWVIAAGVAAIVFNPQVREGLPTKLGLAMLALALLVGGFVMSNDPLPYLPLLWCIGGAQIGGAVAVAGLLVRATRCDAVRDAIRAASGWTPLDEQPTAD